MGCGKREREGGVVGEGRKREEREKEEKKKKIRKYNIIIIIK